MTIPRGDEAYTRESVQCEEWADISMQISIRQTEIGSRLATAKNRREYEHTSSI